MGIDAANANDIRPSMTAYIIIGSSDDGFERRFNNENLLKVVVSLRSDLSKVSPTLPESEIEIEAYVEDDISEQVAGLSEGTPVQFRAGYPYGDPYYEWSDTRYFYTDEPIRWDNGVLYIHAVDQVHKLDGTLSPIFIGQRWQDNAYNQSYYGAFGYLYAVFWDIIQGWADYYYHYVPPLNRELRIKHFYADYSPMGQTMIEQIDGHYGSSIAPNGSINSIISSATRREMIAKLMNLCHQEYPEGFFNDPYDRGGFNNFWLTYVDAGRPSLTMRKPTPTFTIREEDCADVKRSRERRAAEYKFKIRDVDYVNANNIQGMDYVTGTIFKQKAMALEYSGLVDACAVGIRIDDVQGYAGVQNIWELDWNGQWPEKARPYDPNWSRYVQQDNRAQNYYGQWLLDENLIDSDWFIQKYSYFDLGAVWNTPNYDGTTPANEWAEWISVGAIDSNATETGATSRGYYFLTTNEREYVIDPGVNGVTIAPDDYIWNGYILAKSWDTNNELKILPDEGLKAIANRSDEIGSFTWKGDPRMQPRDVFTFVFIEEQLFNENDEALLTEDGVELWGGGEEVRTIENITMTFEHGGLISEITYRKGIC